MLDAKVGAGTLTLKHFGDPQNLGFIDIIKFKILDSLKHFYLIFFEELGTSKFKCSFWKASEQPIIC